MLLCEGGPDFLAAHHFIAAEKREGDTAAVAMLSASLSVPVDALPQFAGKRVRLFTHADVAGRASVGRWARQLAYSGARIDALALDTLRRADGAPVKVLDDLARLHPEDRDTQPHCAVSFRTTDLWRFTILCQTRRAPAETFRSIPARCNHHNRGRERRARARRPT